MPYLIFHPVDFLQLDCDGVFPGIIGGNIADAVGGQISVAILVVGDLVFSGHAQARLSATS
jgi:hypothetical protein